MDQGEELSKSDWQLIKEIVDQLTEIPQEAVEANIDLLCQSRPHIKARVRELIAIHLDVEGCTLTPDVPASQVLLQQNQLQGGDVFGKYTIIKSIGSGGMGHVYLAQRNDEVHQQVAIKVLNQHVLDEQTQARFDTERRILASLEHPNITRLIDAGSEQNKAFYVMEYIEGEPIDTCCQSKQLNLVERLELFLKVCDAVSYAHNNLIVHRDLKPNNILVNESGELKLLDFGIAKPLKLLPGTEVIHETLLGTSALTPQYAAPEQISGDPITVSCDIYVLGLLLYRLLTDQHAFEFSGKSWGQIEQLVSEQLPPMPSKHLKYQENSTIAFSKVKGDLDAIVGHALNKAPKDRYLSVAGLAADIRHYQNHEPIAVRRNQSLYRLKKSLTRHWLPISALLLVFVILLVAVVTIALQRDKAVREQQRAEVISETFVAAFKNANPSKNNGKNITALEIVDQTQALIQQRGADETGVNAELSIDIAEVYRNLGAVDKAYELLKKTQQKLTLLSDEDRVKFFSELALTSMLKIKPEAEVIGIIDEAIAQHGPEPLLLYTKGLILRFFVRYSEASQVLEVVLTQINSNDPIFISTCSLLAHVQSMLFYFSEAETTFKTCLSVVDQVGNDKYKWEKSELLFRKGRLYISMELFRDAITAFEQALGVRSELMSIDSKEVAEIDIFLGHALVEDQQFDKATFHAERAYKSREKFIQENGLDQVLLAKPLYIKAMVLHGSGQYTEAIEVLLHIINMRKDAGIEMSYNTSYYYTTLGESYCALGRRNEAMSAYAKGVAILERPKYNEDKYIHKVKLLKAVCHNKLNEFQEAKELLNELMPIIINTYPKHYSLWKIMNQLKSELTLQTE